MKKLYAIGVGGSGAKCIESLIFLHALGLLGEEIKLGILLIDADPTNGNLARTVSNITVTGECYQLFQRGTSNFMSEEFEFYGIWNPLEGSKDQSFKQYLGLGVKDELEGLLDVLYSPEEREMEFDVGFRGRPPVGSTILGTLEIQVEEENRMGRRGMGAKDPLEKMISHIQADAGQQGSVVHLFGSLFGGTGASGVPSLATMIRDRLGNGNTQINASVLLPYFDFDKPPAEEKVFAERRFFNLNTQAALYHLYDHADSIFDNLYLIGNSYSKKYPSSTGGGEQINEAHFVELYAALGSIFREELSTGKTFVHYICRKSSDRLSWEDIPHSEIVQERLGAAVRTAYAWLYNISLELKNSHTTGFKKFAVGAPWFSIFFDLKATPSGKKAKQNNAKSDDKPSLNEVRQKQSMLKFDDWSEAFLVWAQQVARSHQKSDQLFNLGNQPIVLRKNKYAEQLGEIVVDQGKSDADIRKDCVDRVKNELADLPRVEQYGVSGLVHSLFQLL